MTAEMASVLAIILEVCVNGLNTHQALINALSQSVTKKSHHTTISQLKQ